MKVISIGDCIEKIESEAFGQCSKLENVYCYAIRYPDTNNSAFYNSYLDYVTLHVPSKSIQQYKSHKVWGQFMEVVSLTDDEEGLRPDPILTIYQADNGFISTQVSKGSAFTFVITPCDGWKIHSVSFNEKDVTSQLTSSNVYKTPSITSNSTLSIVYELDDTDGVRPIAESSIHILRSSAGVKLFGVNMKDIIQIYTIDGIHIKTIKSNGNIEDIPLLRNNLYIIKVGERTFKISM